MTIEEINLLSWEDYKFFIANRLNGSIVDFTFPVVGQDSEGRDVFDRSWEAAISPDGYTKPSDAELEAEFEVYRQELIDAENFRLAEIARISAWKSRYNAIDDKRMAAFEAGINESNLDKYFNDAIKNGNEVPLLAIEAGWAIAQPKLNLEKEKRLREKMGAVARGRCTRALNRIAGWNIQRELTTSQITQMETSFAPILQALSNLRPDTAKTLISVIEPDDNLVTQQMLDEVLEALN